MNINSDNINPNLGIPPASAKEKEAAVGKGHVGKIVEKYEGLSKPEAPPLKKAESGSVDAGKLVEAKPAAYARLVKIGTPSQEVDKEATGQIVRKSVSVKPTETSKVMAASNVTKSSTVVFTLKDDISRIQGLVSRLRTEDGIHTNPRDWIATTDGIMTGVTRYLDVDSQKVKELKEILIKIKGDLATNRDEAIKKIAKLEESIPGMFSEVDASRSSTNVAPGQSTVVQFSHISQVLELINKSGVAPEDIFFATDCDDTLSIVSDPLTGHNAGIQKDPTTNQSIGGVLRGGQSGRELLDYLNKNNIRSAVISAATRSVDKRIPITLKSISESVEQGVFSKFFKNQDKDSNGQDLAKPPGGKDYKAVIHQVPDGEVDSAGNPTFTTINQVNGIAGEESGYRKHIAVDHMIKQSGAKPKLLVFVDDAASNIFDIYNHFTNTRKNDNIAVLCCYCPPARGEVEAGAEVYKNILIGKGFPLNLSEKEKTEITSQGQPVKSLGQDVGR